jgi:hypothetical protein
MAKYRVDFSSFADFVRQAENGQPSTRHGRTSRATDRDSWAGGSWAECLGLAKSGWEAGAQRVARMAAPLLEQVSSRMLKPEILLDIEGDAIDVGTYLTGNPEPFLHWTDTEIEAERAGKFVHIVCSVSASSYFTTEQLFSKGAAVAILIDALEMSGRRVIVDVCMSVNGANHSDNFTLTVRVKNAPDPLNMENIALACAHSGMLRRLVFSVEECQPREVREAFRFFEHGTYGYPTDDPINESSADIYIGASASDLINDPLRWAREQLLAQGVHFAD